MLVLFFFLVVEAAGDLLELPGDLLRVLDSLYAHASARRTRGHRLRPPPERVLGLGLFVLPVEVRGLHQLHPAAGHRFRERPPLPRPRHSHQRKRISDKQVGKKQLSL